MAVDPSVFKLVDGTGSFLQHFQQQQGDFSAFSVSIVSTCVGALNSTGVDSLRPAGHGSKGTVGSMMMMRLVNIASGHDRLGVETDKTDQWTPAFAPVKGEIPDLKALQVGRPCVLQERLINRVRENANRKIDIRVIAATHRNLYEEVKAGKFREDLYYRLKVFPIILPPLKQRKKDLPLLINHFLGLQSSKTGKTIHGISS